MGIDTARRTLPINDSPIVRGRLGSPEKAQYHWFNGGWARDYSFSNLSRTKPVTLRPGKIVPSIAFRVLDAPRLKDDFYCSILAYCRTLRTLAVALNHRVYLWTERFGVRHPPLATTRPDNYVTALAFSSDEGRKAILAVTRHCGTLTLWSLVEKKARFEVPHPSTTSIVAFKPITSQRRLNGAESVVRCEDLLVGDDAGRIYYYSIEWPSSGIGSITLIAKIAAHSQNVCGLAWAPHGRDFVSGGNDNSALLFNCEEVLQVQARMGILSRTQEASARSSEKKSKHTFGSPPPLATNAISEVHDVEGTADSDVLSGQLASEHVARSDVHHRGRTTNRSYGGQDRDPLTPPLSPDSTLSAVTNVLSDPAIPGLSLAHRYRFYHSAAVKAIAFAPWQPTLLATGGGSNDKQIHFHHTDTGTTLAIINVFAQVTSLVWSHTRREIAATFGYAQPEHETRIAVFLWPSCECVVSIPWERKSNGEIGRALWAIPYPGGPNDVAPERSHERSDIQDTWDAGRVPDVDFQGYQATSASRLPITPDASPTGRNGSSDHNRVRVLSRGEGERWASRTEEEGSLIIACCDQTVKFFEVWAGKSKGKSHALGSRAGVFGGSKVLEGWCEGIAIDEVGADDHVIR